MQVKRKMKDSKTTGRVAVQHLPGERRVVRHADDGDRINDSRRRRFSENRPLLARVSRV